MIRTELEVEDYCQECNVFEPDVSLSTTYDPESRRIHIAKVHCRNREFCMKSRKMLERGEK